MRAIPEELTELLTDLENFLSDGLKGETLSKKAKERREAFIKRIKDVKLSFPQDFKDKSGDDSDDDEEVDSNNDGASLQSERTDKDEDAGEGAQQSPPVAAQDLTSVFKAGYLEKRRKDHSFFGTEWQKRWCALSHHTFYYYGSEKDKQQKGEFSIDGYFVKMNTSLRKDSKKDCCFEISAPDKRVYQFCASSLKEAEEWVKQIDFVLQDMSGIIPEEEDEMYDDVGNVAGVVEPEGEENDEIYEELPEDEIPAPVTSPPKKVEPLSKPSPPPPAVDKSTDYPNYYQGLWDCVGDQPDELSFKRGESIYILSKEYNSFGWWVGEKNGATPERVVLLGRGPSAQQMGGPGCVPEWNGRGALIRQPPRADGRAAYRPPRGRLTAGEVVLAEHVPLSRHAGTTDIPKRTLSFLWVTTWSYQGFFIFFLKAGKENGRENVFIKQQLTVSIFFLCLASLFLLSDEP